MKVESVEHLIQLTKENKHEFFILLNGSLKSSKQIHYDPETRLFNIYNEIDDSEQDLKAEQLFTQSNIGHAIEQGCFFLYE